jgi:hypothetical protein
MAAADSKARARVTLAEEVIMNGDDIRAAGECFPARVLS